MEDEDLRLVKAGSSVVDPSDSTMSFETSRFADPGDSGGGTAGSAGADSSSSSEDDEEPLASSPSSPCPGGCFPRPPEFGVPPPPLPPSLCSSSSGGGGGGRRGVPPDELQFCEVRPIGAELTTSSAFPSLPVIAVCSSVVLVAVLVASFLLWKHKKKVQNFLPCKSQHQGACDLSSANGGAYSDILLNHHHPTRLPNHLGHGPDTHTLTPIELLDVKYGSYGAPHLTPLTQTNYTFRPTVRPQDHQQRPAGSTLHGGGHHVGGGRRSAPGTSQRAHHQKPSRTGTASSRRSHRSNSEQFNPIYEEVSGRAKSRRNYRGHHRDSEDSEVDEVDARSLASEDEFAEDELSLGEYPRLPESGSSSLQGSTGGDLCPTDSSTYLDRPPSRRLRGVAATSSGKHSHSLERNRNNSTGLQAKHNYYLSKSALAFDQRNLAADPTGAYSSVDLVQPSPPPEPAPSGLFGAGYPLAGSSSGFMVGPDCQYPPVPANPGTFSTFLVPSAAQEDVGDGAAAAENIYASIDDEDSAGPYTIGGVRGTSKAPGLQGQLGKTPMGGRTLSAKEAPSYGDIRPVFPGGAADQNRTLCT